MKDVTLVITSCGRFDLLEKTLNSFFEKNTYPIKKIIITEDSTEGKKLKRLISRYENEKCGPKFHLIINQVREGQLKSIDKAYKEVNTEYIFHCEDDWIFLKEGFIEKSISLLEEDPKLLLIGLRGKEDFKENFFKEKDYISQNGTSYYEVKEEIFTYNPSLKRKKDNDLFGAHEKLKDELYEMALSEFYKKKGYRTIYFKEKYIEHTGDKRHVHFSKRGKNSILDFKIDRMIKKIRYTILKLFGKIK
ncbi:glycosyltransferase [Leptotrichia sp. OH3620_COT-345]|uniref:glycosyltransferase n=1 Tax=Leptotrichia sp. OH3620_COT-345 TaxID=2491048 RepID=UPI000F653815|nr:glycosyltransferase [Leptotrichia sp. OH3620_COT-345]RRD40778.1 glycosyltransferase [Leptotrichia sp. OH3620_COT-345]